MKKLISLTIVLLTLGISQNAEAMFLRSVANRDAQRFIARGKELANNAKRSFSQKQNDGNQKALSDVITEFDSKIEKIQTYWDNYATRLEEKTKAKNQVINNVEALTKEQKKILIEENEKERRYTKLSRSFKVDKLENRLRKQTEKELKHISWIKTEGWSKRLKSAAEGTLIGFDASPLLMYPAFHYTLRAKLDMDQINRKHGNV